MLANGFRGWVLNLVGEVQSLYVELKDNIEDIFRRLNNMISPGIVELVDPEAARIRVRHRGKLSPWVPWYAVAAGQVLNWRCPEIGEQCLLLNYAAGDNARQSVALVGVFSDARPAPSGNPDEHLITYPNGTRVSVDFGAGVLTLHHEGQVVATVTGDVEATIVGDVTGVVDGSVSLSVGQDFSGAVSGDVSLSAGGAVAVEAGGKATVSSGTEVALQAPSVVLETPSVAMSASGGGASAGSFVGSFNLEGQLVIAGPVSIAGDVDVDGNLNVNGDITATGSNPNNHGH